MLNSFQTIEKYLIDNHICRTIVLAGAQDDIGLGALVKAKRKGFARGILIGDEEKIRELLAQMEEDPDDWEIINEKRELRIAAKAIEAVKNGNADLPMKGLIQTSSFLMAVKNPMGGLCDADSLLNEYTAFYYPDQDRMLIAGDCAVNIAPSLDEKVRILGNLIRLARAYQAEEVKCACISVLEKPNPEIQSSVDAAELAKMTWGERITVEGPLALDNALDAEAARHKGIDSKVAGHADVLLMPEIHGGNIFHKCIHFFSHYQFASGLLGAHSPIIMNSRTDDADAKYNSIMSAIMQTL